MEEQLKDIRFTYIHRGASNDEITLSYHDIKNIDGHYIVIDTEWEEDTYIPFHRIIIVWNIKTGEIFYKKRDTDDDFMNLI